MPLPNGKTADWPEPEMCDVPDPVCWLCGGETHGRGRPHKDVIRKTFTNTPHARATESKSLCTACAWILAQKYIRNWSLLVLDGRFEHPTRARIREILLDPPRRYPWLLSIAVSGQKHISFPGYVNRSARDMRVLLEELIVPLPAGGIGHVLEPVEALYAAGFTKEEIRTGQYRQDRIRAFGLSQWRETEEKISPMRGSRILELAVWAAQKGEDQPSSTDSTPRTATPPSQPSASTPSTAVETPSVSKSRLISGGSSSGRSAVRQNEQQLFLFG